MPDEIATPAFVLRTRPYGESDRIVTFITEQHGKVTGIGKGAKNSQRRFAGTLEPFVHVRVVFRQRSASDLVFLVRCELIEALRGLTLDLDRFAAGSYVLDLTDRMVLGRESGGEVYGLVREALTLLAGGASPDPAAARRRAASPARQRLRARVRSLPRLRRRRPTRSSSWSSSGAGSSAGAACPPHEPVRPVGVETARAPDPARDRARSHDARRTRAASRTRHASPRSCWPR